VKRTPLGRLAEAHDIAAAIASLRSPEAGLITGEALVVDGGLTC
jgi:meso-butanediol dehydrogenase/(S,S)-butanediol dehydrogenase/diacetyl reductase